MPRTKIWLDCDPGRDDLIAILFALHLPEIELLGLSSVHGNASIEHMTYNCIRILASFGTKEQVDSIPVFQGAAVPLVQPSISASSVHGVDGLGGVEGLLDETNPAVASKVAALSTQPTAIIGLADACRALPGGEKLTIVATGTMTNVALFISVFPELLLEKVERIMIMGGAEGRGNKTPVAESNIACDAHAASIVFNCELPVVICPLNLTHTALFTPDIHRELLQPSRALGIPPTPPLTPGGELPTACSPLRHTLSTNLTFFAEAYKRKYGMEGPPLHDALTVAYIAKPELFKGTRYRVDVELNGTHTLGSTVVDLWEYKKAYLDPSPSNWGRNGKNVLVLEEVDIAAFWRDVFFAVVDRADEVVPVNEAWREKRAAFGMVPYNMQVPSGKSVEFIWGAGPHTVTQFSALTICNATKEAGAFKSGMQRKGFTFPVEVKDDTKLIWYYCAVKDHCLKGMFQRAGTSGSGLQWGQRQSCPGWGEVFFSFRSFPSF
ncbi:hypothetical protein JCM8547_008818 [Rhodosporidiobolus lusitaniae]